MKPYSRWPVGIQSSPSKPVSLPSSAPSSAPSSHCRVWRPILERRTHACYAYLLHKRPLSWWLATAYRLRPSSPLLLTTDTKTGGAVAHAGIGHQAMCSLAGACVRGLALVKEGRQRYPGCRPFAHCRLHVARFPSPRD